MDHIEVANEHNIKPFNEHPILQTAEGMSVLIDIARKESGGLVFCIQNGRRNWN